ncbi:MAG: hypothetical protein JW733_00370 [Coriobacteriia bacterium]|nr:hypothetical protein [Coriobacteriia bacterium]MBN2841063.1 hypothetical protein [Coriobacteriia bacterium]
MSDADDTATPDPESEETVTTVPAAADAALVEAVGGGLTWVPFALYLGAWAALAAASAYLLRGATAESPARWMPEYPALLWAGTVLSAAGPVLSFIVWVVARGRRPESARRGLLASAMTRGALAAVFGVMIWLGTLYAIELMTMNGVLG